MLPTLFDIYLHVTWRQRTAKLSPFLKCYTYIQGVFFLNKGGGGYTFCTYGHLDKGGGTRGGGGSREIEAAEIYKALQPPPHGTWSQGPSVEACKNRWYRRQVFLKVSYEYNL